MVKRRGWPMMKNLFARSGGRNQIIPGFGLTMGISITMLSFLVLIPLASIFAYSLHCTIQDYVNLITNPVIRNAFLTSITCSCIAAAVNCVFGFLLAWVLVRYDFMGNDYSMALLSCPLRCLRLLPVLPCQNYIPIQVCWGASSPPMGFLLHIRKLA